MLVNGDKMVVKNKVASFLDEGDIVKIIDVSDDGMISFAFGENFIHKGIMDSVECEKHFEKIEEEKPVAPTVTREHIREIMEQSDISADVVFGKCTVVYCKLPNGFVIVESSACVSPENYDEEIGIEICLSKIEDKIWELEGYRLQEELYRNNPNMNNHDACDFDCAECYCDECPYVEEGDDEDDEGNDYSNCDDCDDYACPYNTTNR